MYKEILQTTKHREFPTPKLPWVMTQKWEHVLFIHWPVPKKILREHVPSILDIDTYDGKAWIGVLPFEVSDVRIRGLPRIPFYNSLLEVNVRTYVKYNGISGTYFFSLDANKLAIVLGARMLTLPYKNAAIKIKKSSHIEFLCKRRELKINPAIFQASYKPLTKSYSNAIPGTLAHWLIERYRLWTVKGKTLYQGDIHHKPWSLSPVTAEIKRHTLINFLSESSCSSPPVVHYSLAQRALIWPLRKIGSICT
ncbi:YqjF family protein [Virgibacillus alimentarius]|uniref:YqjF family protein n=1 Tax=Virgibacillus alimentarius TaxID=698769 RepID=UPI000690B53A|nr:DUF2071 domain-containing protein [Virgibacillus alimentarius]